MPDDLGIDALLAGCRGDPLQRTTGGPALGKHIARALDLLGDVREVEVDGECPGEPGCGRQIDEREPCGGLGRVRADLMAYFFDEGEEVIALAAGEGLAEERAELANLAAKARIEAI
ncbi:unannotated protein [freshwater metagenome]|uniref:Unannotated protein n=1 Tax=freshwater metagenome TaxID=449393 RepID=A0A6J6SLG0_9ZZZZ